MTRINIISPSELTDQHLVAEYREIFMIGSALQKSLKKRMEFFKVMKKKGEVARVSLSLKGETGFLNF